MSAFFAAASQVVQGITLIAVSFLVLFLFRLWFREEYSGSFHAGALSYKDVNIAVLIVFAAVYLRSGNIAVPMIFHSVYDILAMMQKNQETTGAMEIVLSLFYSVVLAAAAYYLIHNHEQEIAELWNKIWHKNEEKPA